MSKLSKLFKPKEKKLTDERFKGEKFEDYKNRLKLQKLSIERKLLGRFIFKSTPTSPQIINPNKKALKKAALKARKVRIKESNKLVRSKRNATV